MFFSSHFSILVEPLARALAAWSSTESAGRQRTLQNAEHLGAGSEGSTTCFLPDFDFFSKPLTVFRTITPLGKVKKSGHLLLPISCSWLKGKRRRRRRVGMKERGWEYFKPVPVKPWLSWKEQESRGSEGGHTPRSFYFAVLTPRLLKLGASS